MTTIAFIGLGVMGGPMAAHLAAAGHSVSVHNRTLSRARDWVARHGGALAETPARAAHNADLVITCVGRDEDVRSVVLGPEGALDAMAPGSILIDHTTASAELARDLAERTADRGIGFLDAPVSGGQTGAEQGALSIMVGGEAAVFARAETVLGAYGRRVTLMGPAGAGQLTKMVNQICVAGLIQGLAEGLAFGERAGLDMDRVLAVIGQGAAQSWQMDHRGPTMLADQFDFGFAIDWMRKDLGICLDEARANGARLPVTALIDQFYGDLQADGGGRWDATALIRRLRDA